MSQITFKQFQAEVEEQIALYTEEALNEGVLDAAVSVGQKIASALADFRKKFKRAPTPAEAFEMRKKMREAKKEAENVRAEKIRANMLKVAQAKKAMSSGTRSGTVAHGEAAVRDWIDNL